MLIGEVHLPQAAEARTSPSCIPSQVPVSQPQRLVLELLLQQAVPDTTDAARRQQLVKTLESKGLRPDQHPRLTAVLTALEEQEAINQEWNDADQETFSGDNSFESYEGADEGDGADEPDDLESLLSSFNSTGVLEEDPEEQERQAAAHEDLEKTFRDTNASPVVNVVNRILLQSLQLGASDIHVEPQQNGLRIRFRQDGVLQSYSEPLPARLVPAVTSRFKIMADLDIAERRQAQDGRIRRRFRDRTVDFRVSSLPSRFGEKIVLRLLDSSSTQLGLDK